MALLDVNVLVALVWDSHVHHAAARHWFTGRSPADGWATCVITESGFVRVSSNPKALPQPVAVATARDVLGRLCEHPGHRFLRSDVAMNDPDVPAIDGHRQVTDAVLLTLARRNDVPLVTFDAPLAGMADGHGVELLRAL